MSSNTQADLTGQIAIVTGGSSGYGAGIAEALQDAGAIVWITGRDESTLRAIADPRKMHWQVADVTDPAAWDALIENVIAEHGRIDMLINNAGAGIRIAPLDEQTDQTIEASITTNLTGHLLGCRRVATIMKKQAGGLIVNISSVCADYAWGGWSIYSAAKAGINQFSKCLDAELRPAGVRVTCLSPSWGATHFTEADGLEARDTQTESRCIQPRELGDLVAYLAAMPPHLIASDLTVWPTVQQVEPM